MELNSYQAYLLLLGAGVKKVNGFHLSPELFKTAQSEVVKDEEEQELQDLIEALEVFAQQRKQRFQQFKELYKASRNFPRTACLLREGS